MSWLLVVVVMSWLLVVVVMSWLLVVTATETYHTHQQQAVNTYEIEALETTTAWCIIAALLYSYPVGLSTN